MGLVLKNLTGTECWTFMDDIIIYLDTAEEHAKTINNLHERFRNVNLQLQPEKCVFAKDKVTYLAFELSSRSMEASPNKVKAVLNFSTPRSLKEVRAFIDLASFYRWPLHQIANIAKLLTQLTKKDKIWNWNKKWQEPFDEIKNKLSNTPV
jgi:hypothetical protein